jgi:hypothetical protein
MSINHSHPAKTTWDFDAVRQLSDSLFVLQFEINFELVRKVNLQGQMHYTKTNEREEVIYFLGSVDVRVSPPPSLPFLS